MPGLKVQLSFALAMIGCVLWPLSAWSQLGPNLRPPGLSPDDPIDRILEEGETSDGGAWGGLAEGWELNTENVVYSASKKRQLVVEAPSTVHVITNRQIQRYGWRTLSETLRMIPGVQSRTWLAQFQSVMIRGLLGTEVNNTRILWLENGVPMNDVRDGGIWLDETYPMELIKRVEVVLGPGSALYGAGAFQGVVNIFTKDPRDVPEYGEYRLGYGSFNTQRLSALGALNGEDAGVLLFASANQTAGPGLISDFRLRQLEREAGALAVREGNSPLDSDYNPNAPVNNSDREWQMLHLKATWASLRLSMGFKNIESGFDGAFFFPAERYRFNRQEFNTELLLDHAFEGNLSFLGLLSYRFQKNDYVDYFDLELDSVVEIEAFDDVIADPRYPTRLNEKVSFAVDQHKVFSLAQLQWQPIPSNELVLGVGGRYEGIQAPDFQTDKVAQSFINGSVFLQDEQRFGDWIFTVGGRLDTHREFGPQLSFRGALLAKWSETLLQRLSYGTAFREPSMSQLYIDHFNTKGNNSLNAETLQNVELSTVWRPSESTTLRVDAFGTLMDNLILNEYDESLAVPYLGIDGKFVSRQENAARIYGLEASAKADLDNGWSIFGHYNLLQSEATRGSEAYEQLDYDARHRVGLGMAWLEQNFVGSLMAFLVGPTKESAPALPGEVQSEGVQEVSPYLLLQPHARVRLPGDFGASLQASYAISEGMSSSPNVHYYEEMLGVPVPRLTFLVSLTYPYYE